VKTVCTVLLFLLATLGCRAESFPTNAGVLNVRDFGAKGDGVTDDTAAINEAIAASTPTPNTGDFWGQAKIVFFPAGTYIISAPLIKQDASGYPTYGMELIGESEKTTTIKLASGATGFGDPAHPLGMIHPNSDASAGWAPLPGDGNAAYQNTIQDLTVDIGTGNPGAVGIDYLASNLGAIRNVTVQAGSGTDGVAGIQMTRQDIGPALLEYVTVDGFPIGVDVANLQYSLTIDHLTLKGQTAAGLRNAQNQIAVNALTATTSAPAIINSSPDGEIVLAGSVLHRASGYTDKLISNQGTIVFRNSNTIDGYQSFAGSGLPNDTVSGVLSPSGFVNGASGSFNTQTAIVDAPNPVVDPVSSWVSVATYGAQPSADFTDSNDQVATVVDAAPGIQKAMNSGASTIYFPHGVYYIGTPITIPATVQRIVGLDSSLHPTLYENWRGQGIFRILDNASMPLTIEQLRFDNSYDGMQLALEFASSRTLVVRDTMFPGTLAVNRASTGGQLFMEDVSAAGSNVTLAGNAIFEARQFNFENCGTCAYLSGTPAVIIGFKEEGNTTEVSASDGAKVDLLGGLAYMVWNYTDPATSLFRSDATSTLTASFDEAVINSCCMIANYLSESYNGQEYQTPSNLFHLRSDGGRVVDMLRTGPSLANPSSVSATTAATVAVGGVSIFDAVAKGTSSSMELQVNAASGTVTMTDGSRNPLPGSGSNSIIYSAGLSAMKASLASLTYTAGNSRGTDTLSLKVSGSTGGTISGDTFAVIGGGGNPPDFALTSSASSLAINSGQSGGLTLTITPQNDFHQEVSFACSGGAGVLSCAFSPATLKPSGGASKVMLTVSAASKAASAEVPPTSAPLEALALGVALLFWRRRRYLFQCIAVSAVVGTLASLSGCGSGSSGAVTPPTAANYTLKVTATAGTLQHTVQVQTTVQP
jgi:hypothetical protein